MKKKQTNSAVINKRARYDYDVGETVVAGIALSGAETKSIRQGHVILRGSFVMVKNGELWLNNMQVNPLKTNITEMPENERTRSRKLLVTKKQLLELEEAKKQGKSIIPIKLLTKSRYIKIEIGVGKGKKKYDKREAIKKRDMERSNREVGL
jgi:SsrA-binding protein